PVTVRLLDPPLHEFLPNIEELLVQDARGELDDEGRRLLHAAQQWREANPMLGTRGVRLGILKPGLYRTQVRALFDAAMDRKLAGGDPHIEVMIPLAVNRPELALAISWVREVAEEIASATYGAGGVNYTVGTMVETPRAALVADEIAHEAEFFSFGTNDLTQMTFGFSRDDIEGRFLPRYLELNLLPANPFETLDIDGVGKLVRMAVELGRKTRPELKLGICGEHGGDPASVDFCHEVGLDYVSCSPYRVPLARLAAAHAALAAAGPGSTA
ncbi:MAG TPA: putative PEP-binding protein, partial [Acidimicrobiia bacterium]